MVLMPSLSFDHSLMDHKKKFFFHFSYKGSAYHGWQRQKGFSSIQETIENQYRKILHSDFCLHGCGRTDKGVHALNYFGHSFIYREWDEKLFYQLQRLLPSDIRLINMLEVHPRANAQRSAINRIYEYRFHINPDPFLHQSSTLFYKVKLNFEIIKEAISLLNGPHDFSSFCLQADKHDSTICKFKSCRFIQINDNEYKLIFEADRYLRSMIRILVYEIIKLAQGRSTLDSFKNHLLHQKKNDFIKRAPPQGLYLVDVNYPAELFILE